MKNFRVLVLTFIVLTLTACGTTTKFPTVGEGVVEEEARKQKELAIMSWWKRYDRIEDISWRIMSSNAELCEKTRFHSGYLPWTVSLLEREYRDVARRTLRMGDGITVMKVFRDSPAEAAGLRRGDKIIGVEGEEIGEGEEGWKRFLSVSEKSATGGWVSMTVDRAGVESDLHLRPILACDYPVTLSNDDSVNAYADGKSVIITTGMMRFVENDEELALIISHELAHNTLGHIEKKTGNAILGAIIGGLAGAYIGADFSRLGANVGGMAFSQEFESEADYAGVYYAGRAGYDISDAVHLWRRMGAENPAAIHLHRGSTHPSTAQRFLAIERAVEEFKQKQANGLPLHPEMESSEKKS